LIGIHTSTFLDVNLIEGLVIENRNARKGLRFTLISRSFYENFRVWFNQRFSSCQTEFDFSDAEQLLQCERLSRCMQGLPETHELRERKQLLGPDERCIRLPSTGLSFVNDLQGFFMSRMVSYVLPLVLLTVSLFGIQSQCQAKSAERCAISIKTAFDCGSSYQLDLESILHESNDSSAFEIAESWWRLTSYRTYRIAEDVIDRGQALEASCHQWQLAQQSLIRKSLSLAVESYNENQDLMVLTASTWLLPHLASDTSSTAIAVPVVSDAVEEQELQFEDQHIDQQSAYWNYYEDCERWGVELTQAAQRLQEVQEANPVVALAGTTQAALFAPVRRNDLIISGNRVLQQVSQWLGRTLKQIEFAAIESRVASRTDIMTESE